RRRRWSWAWRSSSRSSAGGPAPTPTRSACSGGSGSGGGMSQIVLVPLFPLAGAVVLLLFGKRLRRIAGVLATLLVAASFGVAVSVLADLAKRAGDDRVVLHEVYRWVVTDGFRISVAFRIDPLSVVMLLVVTGVGALIHWYAVGYMAHDERRGRFFAYLNLFVFSMLILVLAGNFLLMYVGWEL